MKNLDELWLFVGGVGVGLAIGLILCISRVPEGSAQEPWSHGRLECQAPNIGVVAEGVIAPDGTVSRQRQIGYISAQQEDRVFDFVIEPARSIYAGCTFTQRNPINFPDYKYLPFVGQTGVPRRR